MEGYYPSNGTIPFDVTCKLSHVTEFNDTIAHKVDDMQKGEYYFVLKVCN